MEACRRFRKCRRRFSIFPSTRTARVFQSEPQTDLSSSTRTLSRSVSSRPTFGQNLPLQAASFFYTSFFFRSKKDFFFLLFFHFSDILFCSRSAFDATLDAELAMWRCSSKATFLLSLVADPILCILETRSCCGTTTSNPK